MTLARRHIDLKFQLGQGSFGDGGFDTVEVTGLRVSATISKTGGVSLSSLNLRAYGLDLSTMNQLSTLGKPLIYGRKNIVSVTAGDDVTGMALIFSGIMQEAWVDAQGAPDVAFLVTAYTGQLDSLRPLPPSSFPGSADAATIVSGLATQMGYGFENSGVTVQLANPYFPGTGRQQLETVARAGDFNFFVDDVTNVVAIWPRDGARDGAAILVSPDTGLVGYPAHTQDGINVTTVFNPNIVYGRALKVESALIPSSGIWKPYAVTHDLESETPGGKWFTQAACTVLGHTHLG